MKNLSRVLALKAIGTLLLTFVVTANATNTPFNTIPERMEGLTSVEKLAVPEAPNVLELEWLEHLENMGDTLTRGYIEKYWRICVAEYQNGGYRPSMKMAQAIIETGRGKSGLATKVNAHFGIKVGWNSEISTTVMFAKDDKADDCFNGYRVPEDSFRDHSEFMKQGRYRRTVEAPTLAQACYQLGVSGYATSQYRIWHRDGHYSGKPGAAIMAVIKRYNLQMLDELVGLSD